MNEITTRKIISMRSFLPEVFMIMMVVMFAFGRMERNNEYMFFCGLFFLLADILQKTIDINGNIAYILYLLSFFIFLQGRYLVSIIMTGRMMTEFSEDISIHINQCIMISLAFIHIGYFLSNKIHFTVKKKSKKSNISNNIVIDRCLLLFYLSSFFAIMSQIDIIIFVRDYSYVEYYLSYSSHIPRLFQVFGNMYIAFFFIFLCTYPKKERCKVPITVFLLISCLVLLTGDRGGMIQNISALVVYCLWRQKQDKVIWIRPRTITIVFALSPVIMAFLSFFVYLREGLDVGELTLMAQLQRFLSVSGRSANVLGYAMIYKEQFTQKYYTFGGIIDYLKYNPISSSLFGFVKPRAQTAEYALKMHSFDSALSYFVYPRTYLNGHGIGSSYLAEIFFDFGYWGIAVFGIIYSILLDKCKRLREGYVCYNAVMLLVIRSLFYAPRGPALIFVTNIMNITTIGAFFIYFFVSRLKIDKKISR